MSDLQFGVVGKDGVYVRPVPIDCDEIRVELVDDSFDVTEHVQVPAFRHGGSCNI